MSQSMPVLLGRARRTLHWTQRELGENLGWSHRTAARWEAGQSSVYPKSLEKLVQLLFPVDRGLAAEIAAAMGETLVSLGLEAPVAPAAAAGPAVKMPTVTLRDVLDCIVCSVADASNAAPKTVRPQVVLAFRRAVELGFDLSVAANAKLLDDDVRLVPPAEPNATAG